MNRQQRRASDAAAKKRMRLAMQCLVRGHVLEERWIMRPAWVGAGIVIAKVHFDRRCGRCDAMDIVWADVEGQATAQPEAMLLPAWLLANDATVTPPAGEIRLPNTDELAELAKKMGAEPAQRVGGLSASDAAAALATLPGMGVDVDEPPA